MAASQGDWADAPDLTLPDDLDRMAARLGATAAEVVAFYFPDIWYLGDGTHLRFLSQHYPWVNRVDRLDAIPESNHPTLLVLDGDDREHTPWESYLSGVGAPHAVLVICGEQLPVFRPKQRDVLSQALILCLVQPSSDLLKAHVDTMLPTLRAALFLSSGPPILSVDPSYRSAYFALAQAAANYESCQIDIDELSHLQALIASVYQYAPSHLQPIYLDKPPDARMIAKLSRSPRQPIVVSKPSKQLAARLREIGGKRAVYWLGAGHAAARKIVFPPISQRPGDQVLYGYVAGCALSTRQHPVLFANDKTLRRARKTGRDTLSSFFASLTDELLRANGTLMPGDFSRVLAQTPTLENIFATFETHIVEQLFAKAQSASAIESITGTGQAYLYYRRRSDFRARTGPIPPSPKATKS